MSEMLDRIRKELHERGGYATPWETCTQCEDAAKAVLRLMREPTEEMRWAGYTREAFAPESTNVSSIQFDAKPIWQRMIGEALQPSEAGESSNTTTQDEGVNAASQEWTLWWVVAWEDGDLAPEYLAGPWYDKEHATYQAQKCIGRIDSPTATIGLVSSTITKAVIDGSWKQGGIE